MARAAAGQLTRPLSASNFIAGSTNWIRPVSGRPSGFLRLGRSVEWARQILTPEAGSDAAGALQATAIAGSQILPRSRLHPCIDPRSDLPRSDSHSFRLS